MVDTKHGNEVRMEVATQIRYPNFRPDRVIWQNIKSYANIFESSSLIKTTLWVSHNNYLSVFNLISQRWEHHVKFSNRIELLRKREDEENITLAVLERQQGRLFLNVMKAVEEDTEHKKYFFFQDQEPDKVFEGDILQSVMDNEDNNWLLLLCKDYNGNPRLNAMYRNKIYDVTSQVRNVKLKSNIILMFTPDDTSIFLVQNKTLVSFYTIVFDAVRHEVVI